MRILLAVLALGLVRIHVLAVDAFVYPPGSPVTFTVAVSNDTITVAVINTGLTPIWDLYLAEHTINPPQLLSCFVDGTLSGPIPVETDAIFNGARTTRWLAPSFQSELILTYHVPGYFNSHLNWVAFQDGPLFGVVSDPVCCAGGTGNVNNDPANVTDLSDLSMLIGFLTGSTVSIGCPEEANLDGDSSRSIDVSDLALLIAHLVLKQTVPPCP